MMEKVFFFLIGSLVCSATAASLPFAENFDALEAGTLNAQNGWVVQGGTVVVQDDVVQGGYAAELTQGALSHELSNSNSSLWTTFWARVDEVPADNPVVSASETIVAFYVDTNQKLVVHDGAVAVPLNTVIPTNVWTRFDVYCDYDTQTWNLSVNKINVAAGLSLGSTNAVASMQFANGSSAPAYVDLVEVVDQEPVADLVDSDADTLPDWWEQKYFGGVTNAVPTASVLNAYIAGLSPSERFEISSGLPLRWEGQPGRRYSIYATTNLLSGFTLQTNVLWNQTDPVDLLYTNEPAMFYRVEVELDE